MNRGTRRKLQLRGVHAHGCVVCSARYSDACDTPLVDRTCPEHQVSARQRPLWDRHQDPQPCCRINSRLADMNLRQAYRLGGVGPWWVCRSCARTHPYDPGTGR